MIPNALAITLGDELLAQHKTLAFAESCSGGLASSLVTDVAGSSAYLLGSAVTYTNEGKRKLLGVEQATLDVYGAVSEQTALQMAQGVRKLFGSDYGVGITGNAGPGGSEGKPVGLVYIAIATENDVYCEELTFTADRIENKLRIALKAISMVIDKLRVKKMEENT
ncbi:MAG: CinA family protein [Phascolarctobacterium sp.]|nr:CinA family protein [Phascolarctobacterium sp.]